MLVMTCTHGIAHSGAGVGTEVLEAAYRLPAEAMATTGERDGSATTAGLTRETPARAGADSTA